MKEGGAPSCVRADQIKRAARIVGPARLQEYVDHLTDTRTYGWYEVRALAADERRQLAEFVGQENLDQGGQFDAEPVYKVIDGLKGDRLVEHLSVIDLAHRVSATPFVRWYRQEWQRLQRDAQLLANHAGQWKRVADAAVRASQAAFIAVENDTGNGWQNDWESAQARMAGHQTNAPLAWRAAAARRSARSAGEKLTRIQLAVDRLRMVSPRDLVALGAALELFVRREFSDDLSAVDSVAMLFSVWIDEESTTCANARCSQRFLQTGGRRRRPQEYCSPACRMSACRARQGTLHAA